MKSIAQFVEEGILCLADLQDALQTAMRLEFSTIPPYLCAQWSIDSDPSNVSKLIQNIVVQEMYHFALVGNMLAAIRGMPQVANSGFVPKYPTDTLPGGIRLRCDVDLLPLSKSQLVVFMEIERPEWHPVALVREKPPATIGAFYDTIIAGFNTVRPAIDTAAPFVMIYDVMSVTPIAVPKNGQILTIADAVLAVERIKREGEGTEGSPEQPPDDVADGNALAHYYIFKEIHDGKFLEKKADGHWGPSKTPIVLPTIFPFQKSNLSPNPSANFNALLSQLLSSLQECWSGTGNLPNIGRMTRLKKEGVRLIKDRTRPEFAWSSA